jgi:ferredoxin
MRISVDADACTGHARCMSTAPEVYVLDELGFNRMGTFEVTPGLEDHARRGAAACPERAIAVIEDTSSSGGDVDSQATS